MYVHSIKRKTLLICLESLQKQSLELLPALCLLRKVTSKVRVEPVPETKTNGSTTAMKSVCDKYGALFILDEVMSGMGRKCVKFNPIMRLITPKAWGRCMPGSRMEMVLL